MFTCNIALAIGMVALIGCGRATRPAKLEPPAPVPASPWEVATNDPSNPTPALLWNGNVGVRLARNGGIRDIVTSNPLPAFSIDRFEPGGEEKIVPFFDWKSAPPLDPPFQLGQFTRYLQRLNLRTGVLTTEWVVNDRGQRILIIRESILDPSGPPIFAERTTEELLTTLDARRHKPIFRREHEQTFYVPADLDGGNPPSETFAQVKKRAEEAMAEFWDTDIVIEGPVEDQQAIRSMLYYLRTAIHPSNPRAISPMGLSSTTYFGHVFWDADVWVFPALALLDPDRARTIPEYRLRMVEGARQNYLDWVAAGRRVGRGPALGAHPPSPTAIQFPWESSVTGRETVPGPSRFQHHISGTVVFGLWKAAALGLVNSAEVDAVGRRVRDFYLDRAQANSSGGLELRGTMSPDEHFTGNNDLYTNALANLILDRYETPGPRFVLPRDEEGLISYEGDRFRGYKQAAAVLSIYPLQIAEAEGSARAMMDRFEKGVIRNGPAMTDSIHALIWARQGEADRAYATWRASWKDFTDHPLMLFSEKRRKEVTYFTTGAAGCLQTVLFGFAGIRIDREPLPDSPWTLRLKNGFWLSMRPNLPRAWTKLTLRGLQVLGKTYDVEIQGRQVFVNERS